MHKFKVGQKVRIVLHGIDRENFPNFHNKIGVIEEIHGAQFGWEYPVHYVALQDGDSLGCTSQNIVALEE